MDFKQRISKTGNSTIKSVLTFILGGIVFLVIFSKAYENIPDDYYQARDDGVITMSHAKNWIDHGFIGINPSGGRVEGYSAPVQFFIYAGAYAILGIDYERYSHIQTIIFTFILGSIFTLFFLEKKSIAILLCMASALILSRNTPFLEWHGSGMENAITHCLFLASIYTLYSFAKQKRVSYTLSVLVFLASISRIESIYFIAPILVIFSIFWLCLFRDLRGLFFSLLVAILWVLFQLWRYLYFGDLIPNTAHAQNIEVFDRIHQLLNGNSLYIHQSTTLATNILFNHGIVLLIIGIVPLYFSRRERHIFLLFMMISSLVITSYFYPFIFGRTRLDPLRSTTFLVLCAPLAISSAIYFTKQNINLFLIIPTMAFLIFFTVETTKTHPYNLCCTTKAFESIREEFSALAHEESLPRPTVSNPDLGVMSYHKQFNIVDLGMLGSPIMAKLKQSKLMSDYFFNYASPDIIESHDFWSCIYNETIFNDPRFRHFYIAAREKTLQNDHFCGGKRLIEGIWVRKDILKNSGTKERILIDTLKNDLSTVHLRQALIDCKKDELLNCTYVARTAFRFLPEFRQAGMTNTLNEIFSKSESDRFDLYLINSDKNGQLYKGATQFILSEYLHNKGNSYPTQ